MNNALRDQLLKAGLVTEEQVKQLEQRPPRGRHKPGGKRPSGKRAPGGKSGGTDDLARAYAARARQEQREQAERERAEREARERRRAVKAEIQALLERHQLNQPEAEIPYRFVVGEKVKQVYVTPEQQAGLAAGELSIVLLDGKRHIVPAAVGGQVLELDPQRVVIRHEPGPDEEEDVPADLHW